MVTECTVRTCLLVGDGVIQVMVGDTQATVGVIQAMDGVIRATVGDIRATAIALLIMEVVIIRDTRFIRQIQKVMTMDKEGQREPML